MTSRIDITYYDSYSGEDENPSILIDNENFYLIFSLYNESLFPFIDETIYFPKAYFVENGLEEIPLELCNIDKIDSKYKNLFPDFPWNKHYCLSNINYTFISIYNAFKFQIFPCKNTTENNNHCKSKEIIDKYIDNNYFLINFKDILITPLDYKNPVLFGNK